VKPRERPPPMSETLMTGPLGGAIGDPRACTTYVGDIDGGPLGRRCQRPGSTHNLCRRRRWRAPWEALLETPERPPPMSETSMVGALGGADRDPRAPSTYVVDIDGWCNTLIFIRI
jgi:hypothetical protein